MLSFIRGGRLITPHRTVASSGVVFRIVRFECQSHAVRWARRWPRDTPAVAFGFPTRNSRLTASVIPDEGRGSFLFLIS